MAPPGKHGTLVTTTTTVRATPTGPDTTARRRHTLSPQVVISTVIWPSCGILHIRTVGTATFITPAATSAHPPSSLL